MSNKIDWKEVEEKTKKFLDLVVAIQDNSGPRMMIRDAWVELKESLEGPQ